MADHHLTVTRAFGKYRPGDHIEDDAEIKAALAGEHRHAVVKVAVDKKPDPAKADAPANQISTTA